MQGKVASCAKCGSNFFTYRLRPDTIHHAERRCAKCGHFCGFQSKPQCEGTRRSTSKYSLATVSSYYKQEKPACFFCLRTKGELAQKQTLTIDHREELSKGGVDDMLNLQILCTACHKLKNWIRLYFNWHFKGGENENLEEPQGL